MPKLVAGDEAPAFNTKSINGDTIAVSDLNEDGKTVFISFLRYAGCPVCNARIHELSEKYEELKKKSIELIVVFESSRATLLEYTEDAEIPFPIISDPENALYDSFDVKKSFGKV